MSAYITVTDAAGRIVARRPASAREAGAALACAGTVSAAPRAPAAGMRRMSSLDGGVTAEISEAAYAAAAAAAPSDGSGRRTVDGQRGLRAIYDGGGRLRELSLRGRDGTSVRINFPARG